MGTCNCPPVNRLNRNGVELLEVDLTDSKLVNGIEVPTAKGESLRFMRHGSNPGARLQLAFSGNPTDKLWAPGKEVRGGFDGLQLKLASGGARVGKATFAVIKDKAEELSEDLIVSAIGPVDLLGATDANGDVATWVAVNKNTDPTGANPTGSFDGSGWELLRVMMDTGAAGAANCTSFDLHPWSNPYYSGSNWLDQGVDTITIPDTPTSGGRYRIATIPWAGRGLGYFGIYNLNGTAAAVSLIVQGLR